MTRTILFINCLILILTSFLSGKENTPLGTEYYSVFKESVQSNLTGFWENKGQLYDQSGNIRNDILFYHSSGAMKIYLKNNGISYELSKPELIEKDTKNYDLLTTKEFADKKNFIKYKVNTHRIDLAFLNANPSPLIIKVGESEDYNNYYGAKLPDNGLLFVHHYQKIIYKDIYPNIDLVYYVNPVTQSSTQISRLRDIKYDFVIKPGGNISSIKIKYTGADEISLSQNGSLVIKTSLGNIEEATPVSFTSSMKNSESILSSDLPEKTVDIKYILENNILSFTEADYDKDNNLIIDPRLIWGTYYGGGYEDQAIAVAVDRINNIVVTGYTRSNNNIATAGAHKVTADTIGADAFILKLDSTGKRKWCTYYGGVDTNIEYGTGIGCFESDKSVAVAGITYSNNGIATSGAYQTTLRGLTDVFLVRFDSNGVRKWGTYYGGDATEGELSHGVNLNINRKGDILMTGWTYSTNGIATPGAYKTVLTGNMDAFIVRFDSSGNRKWGTYYGINGVMDYGTAITSDQKCNTFVTGKTYSSAGLATPGTHQFSSCDGDDGFVVKFDSTNTIVWGTYFGGCSSDICYDIFPDAWGNVVITGETKSLTDISTPNTMQPVYGGGASDAFLVKLDTNGKRLWGTYYGGTGLDIGLGLTQDKYRNIVLTGLSDSPNNITTVCTQRMVPGDGMNQFLSKFGPDGSIQWGTFYCDSVSGFMIGGGDVDIDKNGDIIIVGGTGSKDDVATPGAHQTQIDTTWHASPFGPYQIIYDAFIGKFGPVIPPSSFKDSKDDEIQYSSVCLTAGPVRGPYCVGQEMIVPYKTFVTFNPGNVFTAKLSDKYGTFGSNATIIGTKTGTTSDTIRGTIPVGIPFGRSYRVMVTASNEPTAGEPNPYEITIGPCFGVDSIYGPFCQGEKIDVTFAAFLNYNANNVFTAQLSDMNGNFSSPVDIGSINATASNTITATIPVDIAPGRGYRIRIVASSPQLISDDNGTNITINPLPLSDFTGPNEICFGRLNEYVSLNRDPDLLNRWFVQNGEIVGSPTDSTVLIKWYNRSNTKLKLIQKYSSTGCTDSIEKNIDIINIILPDSIGESPTCDNIEITYKAPQNEYLVDHKWIVTGGTIVSGETDSIVKVVWNQPGTGKLKLIINFTDDPDCKDSVEQTFTVKPSPVVTLDSLPSVCVNDNSFYLTGGNPKGGQYSGPGVYEDGLFYPNVAGPGAHTITYTYTGQNGCIVSKSGTLTVNPIPSKPVVSRQGNDLSSNYDYGNQWYYNNAKLPGDTSKILRPKKDGRYSVQVTDSNGCVSEMSEGYDYLVDVKDNVQSKLYRIYPNPAQDKLMIEVNSEAAEIIRYKLFNNLGESLISSSIILKNNQTIESVNLKNINNGVYFLEIIIGNSVYFEKLIIRK